MRGAESPNGIVMQFCTWVDIRDVVTTANIGSSGEFDYGVHSRGTVQMQSKLS